MAGFEHLLKSYDVGDMLDEIASADPPAYLRRCFAEGCSTPSLSWPRVQQLALCAMVLDSIVNDRDYDVFEPELIADWRSHYGHACAHVKDTRGAGIAPGARNSAPARPRSSGGAGRTRASPGARVDALAQRVRLRGRGGIGRVRLAAAVPPHAPQRAAAAAGRTGARLLRLASADHHAVRHFAAGNSTGTARGAAVPRCGAAGRRQRRTGIAMRSSSAPPPQLARTPPDEYMLCFVHDRLDRIEASVRLPADGAARISPPRAHIGSRAPRRPRHPPIRAKDATARSASARASATARNSSGGRRAGAVGAHAVDQPIQRHRSA